MENSLEISRGNSDTTAKEFLEVLLESKKLPAHIRSVEDAYTIAQMGRELGFATMQAFHYIIPIQGRLSLSAKAIGALLMRAGIRIRTISDAEYVFDDGTTSEYSVKPGAKAVDRITTLEFRRGDTHEEVSYTWVDAQNAGYTTKDNWKRMPE